MLSRLRKRLTYANVAATLAVFFAMSGGAYAASKYLITSTKQIKPSVLKQLTGKAGPAGKAGANGANGTNGAAGEKGAAGTNGTNGTNGSAGANGESVTNTEIPVGNAKCASKEGGAEFKVGSGAATHACNGKTGFTATLPSGKTETGTWSFGEETTEQKSQAGVLFVSASFAIQLAEPLVNEEGCGKTSKPACKAHFINAEDKEVVGEAFEVVGPSAACPGSVEEPKAEPGNFCVYTGALETAQMTSEQIHAPSLAAAGAGRSGAIMIVGLENVSGPTYGAGSWAVTAP